MSIWNIGIRYKVFANYRLSYEVEVEGITISGNNNEPISNHIKIYKSIEHHIHKT